MIRHELDSNRVQGTYSYLQNDYLTSQFDKALKFFNIGNILFFWY